MKEGGSRCNYNMLAALDLDKEMRVEMDTLWGFTDKGLYCNTDLCCDHKFRHQLCTKEFKGR